MKKQVPIFVAGSKEFREQRLALKAMANDLNAEFLDQKKDVVINMWSYENFGNHQQEYNQFISDIAELVIFVLDGGIGEYTESEFRLAVAKYKKDDSPKILVFLKDYKEKTDGIQKIEDLLEEAFGPEFYYISYRSTEELCTKAKEHIRQHANHYLNRKSIIRRAIGLMVMLLLFVASFTTMRYFALDRKQTEPEPMLVFVGGGSVANYLADTTKYSYNIHDNSSNAIYVNMPSTQAYMMLSDEIFENHKNFYPICLSAKEASVKEFTENSGKGNVSDFEKKGILMYHFLGYDTLEVHFYFKDKSQVPPILSAPDISCHDLEELIRNDTLIWLYTTRQPSGTYIAHNDSLHHLLDAEFSKRSAIFYETYSVAKLCNDFDSTKYKGFAVFCSKSYLPKLWEEALKSNPNTYFIRSVTTTDHKDVLCKPMYIYLPAKKESDGHYTIKSVARKFLKSALKINFNNDTLLLQDWSKGAVLRPIKDFSTR